MYNNECYETYKRRIVYIKNSILLNICQCLDGFLGILNNQRAAGYRTGCEL